MKTIEILSLVGVLALLAEIFRFKKLLLPIVLVGLLSAAGAAVYDWNTNIHYYYSMLTFDNYALLFSIVLCITVLLWFLSSQDYFSEDGHITDKTSLAIFSLIGAVIIVSYSNMVMLFLGIEILSIPLYVMAGSRKDNSSSNEAALKYFLMGAFASAILLFGIALVYGATGTFDLAALATYLSSPEPLASIRGEGGTALLYAGIIMLLAGIAFKVAAAPFHFWTPDVYEGSPAPVTAFMASIVKTAAFAAFLRLFMNCFIGYGTFWTEIIWVLAAFSILLGNITAVYQSSVKRILAYSSIAHAGYMLLAILTSGSMSAGAVLFYSAAYSVATIGAFTVISIIENKFNSVHIDSFTGLAKKNPLLAFAMTLAMLSLAGIPPLAGFFGKYYLFASSLQAGYIWIVLVAVLGSLIGVYYYFRVIIAMYSKGKDTAEEIQVTALQKLTLLLTILLSLALGVFPEYLIRLI